jgi:hypothetical protein
MRLANEDAVSPVTSTLWPWKAAERVGTTGGQRILLLCSLRDHLKKFLEPF